MTAQASEPQDPAATQALDTAQGFADKATAVMNVAPWADHQTVASVAQGTPNPAVAVHTVSQLGDVLAQSWDGFVQSYDDPVLQQQPSLQSAVAGFVHQTSGPPPIAGGTLLQVQGTLQSAGYGKTLSADGAWTQQWQQQLNAAENDEYQTQAAGKKPGSITTSSVIHSIGHLFTPSGIGDTFIGWAKNVRDLAGDSLATAANVPTDVSDLFSGNLKQTGEGLERLTALPLGAVAEAAAGKQGLSNTAAQLGADVQSVGGPHVTANQYTQEQGTWRALSDALTVLSMTGLGGLGEKTIGEVGVDIARGRLDPAAPELARGPQVIARTLFNADNSGKLIGSRWLANAPVASRLAPVVGRVAGQDGWYYKLRTLGAQVYKYPLARAAGTVYSKATVGAIGARALGEIPGTQYGKNIQDEHVLDALDANLANHGPRLFGQPLLDPDNVGMFLHGPLGGAGSASDTVGKAVQSAHQGVIDVTGSKGFGAAMEQSLADGNKLMTRDQQLQSVGGDPFALTQFQRSLAQMVAHDHYIEQQLGHPFQSTSQADVDAAKVAEDQYYRDPQLQVKALADALQGDTEVQWATNRLKGYFLTKADNPRDALSNSFAEWHQATKLGQQAYAAGDFDHFVTPKTMATFNASVPPEALQGAGEVHTPDSATLKTLAPPEKGMYGLARDDYETAPQIHAQAEAFRQEMPLHNTEDSYAAFNAQVREWMFEHMGRDARSLGVMPTDKLLDQIDNWADGQASDVWINPINGSPGAQARFQAVKDAGYKWVVGQHIGHAIDGSEPDLGALEGYTKPMRAFIQRAGLNPGSVRDTDIARATSQNMLQSLIDARRNDSSIKWGAQVTAHTIMGLLVHDKAIEGLELPWYERSVFSALKNRGVNASAIQNYIDKGATPEEATAKLQQDLAFQQSVRDLPASKIIHTLENPQDVTTRDGGQWTWPGMDHASAVKTARAINKGYKLPTYMMGWSAIENTARSMQGFPLADKAVARFPDSNLLSAAANWPNNVIRIRNALKFTMNPKFDYQRLLKINAKMALEGVDPVQDALGELQRTGDVNEAQKLLASVTGQGEDAALDADKYARSQSIFGIMSPQWHAAYFLLQKSRQGVTGDALKASYNRVFKYGSNGGRTALERSVNTVLYPFSFEKTVMRNFGAHFLDHPGQALLLDNAVEEWRKADKNAAVGDFVRSYAPALTELNQLNAFSHGISPGQFGGINAGLVGPVVGTVAHAAATSTSPSQLLLNLFLPQSWGPQYTKATLQQYLPVWKEFAQVWQAASDQTQIGFNALANTRDDILQKHTQPRTLIAPSQQLGIALQTKAAMVSQAQAIIDFNDNQTDDASKIPWPSDKPLPGGVQGQPIDKTTIGEYVQGMYPAYNPNAAASTVENKAQQAKKFIAQIGKTDPQTALDMTAFNTTAQSLVNKINGNDYTDAQLAPIQGSLQQAAQQLAGKNSQWLTFYDRYWKSSLGPITDWTGRGTKP